MEGKAEFKYEFRDSENWEIKWHGWFQPPDRELEIGKWTAKPIGKWADKYLKETRGSLVFKSFGWTELTEHEHEILKKEAWIRMGDTIWQFEREWSGIEPEG